MYYTRLTWKSVWKWQLHSCVWPFEAPWTLAHQAPLPTELSKQQYWSLVPLLSPGDLPNPGNLGLLHHYKQGLNPWVMIGAVPHFPSASSNREPETSYHTVDLSPFPLWWFSLLSRFSSWPVSSLQPSPWWPAVHRPCYADGAVGCIFSVICHNFDGSFFFLEGLFFAFFKKIVFGGRHYFSN